MTLLEIIAAHEGATAPQPIARTIALTPKGDALVAFSRFRRALAALSVEDRGDVLQLVSGDLRESIRDLVADIKAGA